MNAHFSQSLKNEFSETQTEAQLRPRSERERVEENLFFFCNSTTKVKERSSKYFINANMKILIDLRVLARPQFSGITEYAKFLISHLLSVDQKTNTCFFTTATAKFLCRLIGLTNLKLK